MSTELVTYRGDPVFKAAFLAEIGKHEAADAVVQGFYADQLNGQFRGCAVGCSLHSLNLLQGKQTCDGTSQHARYPAELGWPLWLAFLEDNIFEQLPVELAKTWPRRLSEAVPVGVTVPDRVLAQILRWCLVSEPLGCVHATDDAEVKGIVARMGALFDRSIAGDEPSEDEWNEAASDARAARAASAARDAWAAWAAWAASDAWDASAARDARDASDAWAAWAARAASAARDASDAWAAWAASDARDARAARAASAASDAWAAWAAWAASDARAASAARDASDAWAAWAASDARDARAAFYPALSEEVLRLLRELAPATRNERGR